MTITHLSADAASSDIAAILARDGCVVIDRLASVETIDDFLSEMEPHLDATPVGPDSFTGFSTRRTGALVARSETARTLVMHPTILGTVGEVLEHATNYQLHLTQVIAIGPDSPAQPVHRDQWAYDFFSFPKDYEVQCNTLWAATDFREDNGATRVVVGSNHHDDGLRYELADTEPAEMEKGSVLLYTGALYHGGGANRSSETRVGINITYNVAWLRQEENQYLSVPREVAVSLDQELQRLIGYARGSYALGYIDDIRDPIEVLRPGAGTDGLGDVTIEELRTH